MSGCFTGYGAEWRGGAEPGIDTLLDCASAGMRSSWGGEGGFGACECVAEAGITVIKLCNWRACLGCWSKAS